MFFCACEITGYNTKNKKEIVYANVSSVTGARIGKMENENVMANNDIEENDIIIENEGDVDSDYSERSDENRNPILFDQNALDDIVRDLGLAKDGSELLASRLKERYMLAPGTKVCSYRNREEIFIKYFSQCENLVYCNDVRGLINEYESEVYDPNNFRLFIDSCKQSLKAVFLHNGNKYAPIPLAHSTTLNESYENIKFLLEKIKYVEHEWLICGDFKMINLLLGQQSGFTKYPCFLCEWDSRDRDQHWIKKVWPVRKELKVGSKNVIHTHLVDRKKIYCQRFILS